MCCCASTSLASPRAIDGAFSRARSATRTRRRAVFINKCLGPRATGEMEWRSESALTRSRSSRRARMRKHERKEQDRPARAPGKGSP